MHSISLSMSCPPGQPSATNPEAVHVLARTLDREADALLFQGRHALAERLAFRAAELREIAI